MNEKKTAEEMLKEYADNSYINSGSLGGSFNGLDRIPFVVWPSVVKIMQEYAAQETAALHSENERLNEALKEFEQILLDYKSSSIEVNIDYLINKFPKIENAKKLIKADSQEQNRQPQQPELEQ